MRQREATGLFVTLLLVVAFILVFCTGSAWAGPTITIDCDSVDIVSQTSIPPDLAEVEIFHHAGSEQHFPDVVGGGINVSYPHVGQDGETVAATLTLHYGSETSVQTAEVTLECAVAAVDPSPAPTVSPTDSPTPAPEVVEGAAEAAGDSVQGVHHVRGSKGESAPSGLPEELAVTGSEEVLIALAGSLIAAGAVLWVMGAFVGRRENNATRKEVGTG